MGGIWSKPSETPEPKPPKNAPTPVQPQGQYGESGGDRPINDVSPPSQRMQSEDHHHHDEGPGTVVRDNVIIGDPRGVRIGEGNHGGRRTGGRVTGNVVVR